MSLDPGMRREVLEYNLVAGGVGRLPDSEDEDKEVQHYLINSHVAVHVPPLR